MKKIKNLFIFQLKVNIRSIAIFSLILFGVMSLYMCFFSSMQEIAQVKFEMLPQEYLQLMGIEDLQLLNNYVAFFGMIFNILLIVISIYAISLGINILLKEEKNKTIEYLYSLELTRTQIYLSKIILAFISVVIVVFATGLAGVIFGYIVGDETFVIVDLITIIKISGLIPFLFLAIGIFMAATSSKYTSTSLGCGIVMLSYLFGYLGKILENKGEIFKYLSPFELLSPNKVLDFNLNLLTYYLIIILIIIILLVISIFTYNKRDFNL